MKLRDTRKHWEKFARTDPLWAVLTTPGKKGNKWDREEFFRTGVESVAAEIKGVQMHYPALRFGSALDFGCGVGRLSQALALHFQRVVGIDISEAMLEQARGFNRHGDKVQYLLNAMDDLRQLPDGQFDFVYSVITLQHMEPRYAKRYIAEFVRVAAPGGVIMFQLPETAVPSNPKPNRPFTLWPDTLIKRAIRDWRARRARGPIMEMHAIPRPEVEATLRAAGAKIIITYRYDAAGSDLPSWGYMAVKPATTTADPIR